MVNSAPNSRDGLKPHLCYTKGWLYSSVLSKPLAAFTPPVLPSPSVVRMSQFTNLSFTVVPLQSFSSIYAHCGYSTHCPSRLLILCRPTTVLLMAETTAIDCGLRLIHGHICLEVLALCASSVIGRSVVLIINLETPAAFRKLSPHRTAEKKTGHDRSTTLGDFVTRRGNQSVLTPTSAQRFIF